MNTKRIAFNSAMICFLVWATVRGYVVQVFTGDVSHISYGIVALFVVGMVAAYRGKHVHEIPEWLVTLGLIGNVIGFLLALSGVHGGDVGTAEGAQRIATALIGGMSVAFYSTLVGAVTALWIQIDRRIANVTDTVS